MRQDFTAEMQDDEFLFPAIVVAFFIYRSSASPGSGCIFAAASTAFDATGQEGRVVACRGRPISVPRGQLRLGVRLGDCLFL